MEAKALIHILKVRMMCVPDCELESSMQAVPHCDTAKYCIAKQHKMELQPRALQTSTSTKETHQQHQMHTIHLKVLHRSGNINALAQSSNVISKLKGTQKVRRGLWWWNCWRGLPVWSLFMEQEPQHALRK